MVVRPAVDRAEIDRELPAMADAGIGGVEVAYVYPLCPPTATSSDRAQFLADLRYAAEAAQRSACASISPWARAGPSAARTSAPSTPPASWRWERREIGPGLARRSRWSRRWPGDELIAAYLGAGSLQETPDELSRCRSSTDRSRSQPGVGTRVVLLAYAQHTGQNVKRAALGAEGPVLDHYSAAAARSHLRHVGDPPARRRARRT